jgi:hypothetical protein
MPALVSPSFGPDGLVILTTDQLRDNLRARTEAAGDLGPEVSTGLDNLYGILIDITAAELGELYELVQAVYDDMVFDNAEGVPLQNLGGLRGTKINPARASVAPVELSGTSGTPIPKGSKVAIPQGGAQWATDEDVTIGGGGTVDTTVTCTETGPVQAAEDAISVIIDSVSGWTGVTNTAAAEPGEDIETDADYRVRTDTATSGSTTDGAIFTRLSELDYINAAVVVSNRTDETDSDGIPPHTLWIVLDPIISDPDKQLEIAETIWGPAGVPPGIGMRGAITATATDVNGYENTIAWDWRTVLDVYPRVNYLKDASFPADGVALIRAALLAWGSTLQVNQDLNPAAADKAICTAVPGITWIATSFRVGASPTYPTYNVPLVTAINELGVLNDDEVTVVEGKS